MHQIDVTELKQAFHRRAVAIGVDPVEGATVYQAANVAAETRKAAHHKRMTALTARHEYRIVYGIRSTNTEGVGRDGYEARLLPTWWRIDVWDGGGEVTEVITRLIELVVLLSLWRQTHNLIDFPTVPLVLEPEDALTALQITYQWTQADADRLNALTPLREKRAARGEKPIWVEKWRHGEKTYERMEAV